jgi:hypothetical protein
MRWMSARLGSPSTASWSSLNYGPYPHHGLGKEVRRILHKLRSVTIENFEQFKGIFDGHGQVPTKGLINTQRFVLGAIFVYQLASLYRFEHGLDLRVGLKAFLKAAWWFMARPQLADFAGRVREALLVWENCLGHLH